MVRKLRAALNSAQPALTDFTRLPDSTKPTLTEAMQEHKLLSSHVIQTRMEIRGSGVLDSQLAAGACGIKGLAEAWGFRIRTSIVDLVPMALSVQLPFAYISLGRPSCRTRQGCLHRN